MPVMPAYRTRRRQNTLTLLLLSLIAWQRCAAGTSEVPIESLNGGGSVASNLFLSNYDITNPKKVILVPIPECQPVKDYQESRMEERLCTCQTAWTHHQNPLLRNDVTPAWKPDGSETSMARCREAVMQASRKVLQQIGNTTLLWPVGAAGCRFRRTSGGQVANLAASVKTEERQPESLKILTEEKALRESVQSRGDPRRLAAFYQKLQACNGDDIVSIAVLGGSMTWGHSCDGHIPKPTDFLGLPNITSLNSKMSTIQRGNEKCPWANRLRALLTAEFPSCKFVDVYNFAAGATDTEWALTNVVDTFMLENTARGGVRLGDVLDLVIVEYGVNDGFPASQTLKRHNMQVSWEAAQEVTEATTEYLLRSLLTLPSNPAVMYLETGSPTSGLSSSPAHLEASERFGVPFASFRKRLSYPDNPYWETFRTDSKGEIISIHRDFRASPKWSTNISLDFSNFSHPPICAVRDSHHYARCWEMVPHPHGPIHNLIAETAFYFIYIEAAAASIMMPTCKEHDATFKRALPSENALRLSKTIDPRRSCPGGALTHYSSQELFGASATVEVGANAGSRWVLVQDRPNKFGWVLESATGDVVADTINFNVTLGIKPHITFTYMHSYEGVGSVRLTLTQGNEKLLAFSPRTSVANTSSIKPHFGMELIGHGQIPIVDAYVPEMRNALYTEVSFKPTGFQPGPAVLHVTLESLSADELAKRGGGKFKITSVYSC